MKEYQIILTKREGDLALCQSTNETLIKARLRQARALYSKLDHRSKVKLQVRETGPWQDIEHPLSSINPNHHPILRECTMYSVIQKEGDTTIKCTYRPNGRRLRVEGESYAHAQANLLKALATEIK